MLLDEFHRLKPHAADPSKILRNSSFPWLLSYRSYLIPGSTSFLGWAQTHRIEDSRCSGWQVGWLAGIRAGWQAVTGRQAGRLAGSLAGRNPGFPGSKASWLLGPGWPETVPREDPVDPGSGGCFPLYLKETGFSTPPVGPGGDVFGGPPHTHYKAKVLNL